MHPGKWRRTCLLRRDWPRQSGAAAGARNAGEDRRHAAEIPGHSLAPNHERPTEANQELKGFPVFVPLVAFGKTKSRRRYFLSANYASYREFRSADSLSAFFFQRAGWSTLRSNATPVLRSRPATEDGEDGQPALLRQTPARCATANRSRVLLCRSRGACCPKARSADR